VEVVVRVHCFCCALPCFHATHITTHNTCESIEKTATVVVCWLCASEKKAIGIVSEFSDGNSNVNVLSIIGKSVRVWCGLLTKTSAKRCVYSIRSTRHLGHLTEANTTPTNTQQQKKRESKIHTIKDVSVCGKCAGVRACE